jgi:hypothetical protein
MRCVKCGRKLTREPVNGMGPVCARAAFGSVVLGQGKQRKASKRPTRREEVSISDDQLDMFPVERRFLEAVAGVSLEMA